jgi:hypothetical protein
MVMGDGLVLRRLANVSSLFPAFEGYVALAATLTHNSATLTLNSTTLTLNSATRH